MIALVVLESPLQSCDAVTITLFCLLVLLAVAAYAVWYTDAVHLARTWAMTQKTSGAMFVLALVGRETYEQREQRLASAKLREHAEEGGGGEQQTKMSDLDFEADSQELGNTVMLILLFAIITCFYGADVSNVVRDVDAGVAATLGVVECLVHIAWIVEVRFALKFRLNVDLTLVSALGIVVNALVLADTALDPLAFGIAWPLSSLLAIGVRFWAVYATDKSTGPSARAMQTYLVVASELFVWGLLLGVTQYTVFNAGLFVGPGFALAFFIFEFSRGVGRIWTSAAGTYMAGKQDLTLALSIAVPWFVFRVLITSFASACALTGGNTPAAVTWLLWPFVFADAACTFWVAFRTPSKPSYAAAVCVSSVIFAAAVCAPPVSAGSELAAPLVLGAAWLAATLGVFVPDIIKAKSLELFVASSIFSVSLFAGLTGFALTLSVGRSVLPPASSSAFAALVVFATVQGLLAVVAIWVSLDGLRVRRRKVVRAKQS